MKFRRKKSWLITLIVISTIILGLVIFWPKAPQIPQVVNDIEDLELYLEELVDFGTPPGMSLVVVNKEGIVYEKGFGWADNPQMRKASSETVYHWWSITKIATAMAIMQLQEEGKLHLDDSVTQYLPFFDVNYPSLTSQTISIRMLLNHSSGIPDAGLKIMKWVHHEGEAHLNQSSMVEEVLPDFSELAFEPGTQSAYTNIGYMILGAVIEKVTNQSYEDYIRQNILQPLGMKQTDFVYTKEMEPFEAAGSHPIFDSWTPLVPFLAGSFIRESSGNHMWFERIYTDQTPPSGLIGSARDAALLVRAYVNKGMLDDVRFLSEEAVELMTHESHVKLAEDPEGYFVRQGIGWQIYKDDDGLILEHTGGGIGFNTIMQIHPEKNLGFILFANDTKCEGWRIIQLASSLNW